MSRNFEPQLLDGALELLRGRRWVLRGDRGQARIARRVLRDGLGELVIRRARETYGQVRVENLHAGRRERQDLHVDAARIHVPEAALSQILEPLRDDARALARVA